MAGALTVLAPAPLPGQETPRAHRASLQPSLERVLARAGVSDTLAVVVEYAAPPTPPAGASIALLQRRSDVALASLDSVTLRSAGGLRVRERLWIVPAALADATPAAVERLAADPAVARIYLDERLRVDLEPSAGALADPTFTSEAMQIIGADAVWNQGVTGEGVTVAFFDSGVDADNAMVASRWRGRRTAVRASWFDPFLRASVPQDVVGHGTQVAVAAVGALAAGDTLRFPDGTFVVASSDIDVVTGPAPRAEWIAARVFERFGGEIYTRRSVLLQAFQWALDPDGSPSTPDGADVINNSWGIFPGTADFDACTDVLYDAIDAAEAAGTAVLFAAGNTGPAPGTVTPPGARDDPGLRSMAVGATTGPAGNIAVADLSGRGPSPCAGGIKPELVAPGTVPEVRAAGDRAARLTGFSVGGTSFSVAQVSGTLALVRQVRPSSGPEEAKRILIDTAEDLGPAGPDNDAGYGLLDVPAAVQRANASFAGGLLQAAVVRRTADSLYLGITNRGDRPWPGGEAWIIPESRAPVTRRLRRLDPGDEARLGVGLDSDVPLRQVRLAVTDDSGAIVLSRVLVSGPPNLFGAYVLEAGDLAAGGNDFGRFGRIAAFRGFEWRGTELLAAAGLAVAGDGALSDGMYTTVLGQPALKASPPAAETDWAPSRADTNVEATRAEFRFDDLEALNPVGLEVRGSAEASDEGSVGALTLTVTVRNLSGGRLVDATPAAFADWDLTGGERARWSDPLQAMVTEPLGGGAPMVVLASEGDVVGSSSVPLGTPGPGGLYEVGSGVLWDEFTETAKRDLVTGGAATGLPGFASATDRAVLLSTGPFDMAAGESRTVRFWLLAGDSEEAIATRLAQLREEPILPPGGGGAFAIQPPFPNPLRVGDGVMTFPYVVPESARLAGRKLVFEVYDVAGRRLVRQTHVLGAAGELPRVAWDGRLAGGLEAASGAYLYVLRLGDETRAGRIVLLR